MCHAFTVKGFRIHASLEMGTLVVGWLSDMGFVTLNCDTNSRL